MLRNLGLSQVKPSQTTKIQKMSNAFFNSSCSSSKWAACRIQTWQLGASWTQPIVPGEKKKKHLAQQPAPPQPTLGHGHPGRSALGPCQICRGKIWMHYCRSGKPCIGAIFKTSSENPICLRLEKPKMIPYALDGCCIISGFATAPATPSPEIPRSPSQVDGYGAEPGAKKIPKFHHFRSRCGNMW